VNGEKTATRKLIPSSVITNRQKNLLIKDHLLHVS